jgi:hypothetical protein
MYLTLREKQILREYENNIKMESVEGFAIKNFIVQTFRLI